MAHKRDYNWIDDPFDEKKIAEDERRIKVATGLSNKILIGLIIVLIIVFVLGFGSCAFLGGW